jgi:hypothetical protein
VRAEAAREQRRPVQVTAYAGGRQADECASWRVHVKGGRQTRVSADRRITVTDGQTPVSDREDECR